MADDARELSKAELRGLLSGRHLAVISTNGPDGAPQSTPVWYLPDGDTVGIIAEPDSVKVRNLRRDASASVVIASERRPYRYVIYRGDADLLTEGVDDYPLRMAERYLGAEKAREYMAEIEPHAPFVVIKVRPTRVTTLIYPESD